MNYRNFGQIGLKVSEIGFGAWGIGGVAEGAPAYGPTNDHESMLALRRAYDLGINFYDTSNFYGYGHSERLIGETFQDVRHEVVISTKVGFLSGDGAQDFSPENIVRSAEASLERLRTDYIDLYQLHSPSIDLFDEDERVLAALKSLQAQGKVRTLGVSVRSPDDALTAVNKLGFQAIEVNFNLVDQRASNNGLLDLCRREGVGVVARAPLCFGFLTGAYSSESNFDSTDHRSSWSSAQMDRWATAPELFGAALHADGGHTPAQLALRFCISFPGVSVAIPGMLTQEEVEENVVASDLGPFSEEELRSLEQIYSSNTFFVGRG